MADFGADLGMTYFDVPKLRVVPPASYLTAGLGYNYTPHRDTWYSAPQSQNNWWAPIRGVTEKSCMVFHPEYWQRPAVNTSSDFDAYEWNRSARRDAALYIKEVPRPHPRLTGSGPGSQIRILGDVGSILSFSGHNFMRRCRTRRTGRDSASTSGPCTWTIYWGTVARRTSIPGQPARHCATTGAPTRWTSFPTTSSRSTTTAEVRMECSSSTRRFWVWDEDSGHRAPRLHRCRVRAAPRRPGPRGRWTGYRLLRGRRLPGSAGPLPNLGIDLRDVTPEHLAGFDAVDSSRRAVE